MTTKTAFGRQLTSLAATLVLLGAASTAIAQAAARKLRMLRSGVVDAQLEVVQ